MKYLIFLSSLVLFFFCQEIALAQSKVTKKADQAFNSWEYFKAIELYKEAYKKAENKEDKVYTLFQTAECYNTLGNSVKAEMYYSKAINRKYKDPLAVLYLADMMKMNGKYDLAILQYEAYSKLDPKDPRGQEGMISCSTAVEWISKPTRYLVQILPKINSKEREFSPVYSKNSYDEVYFTSTRPGANLKKINPITGENFTDIFESFLDRKGQWSEPAPISDTINSPSDEGSPCFTKDKNTMYFTRCKTVKGRVLGCQIYVSTRQIGGDWDKYDLVPIAADSISVGHPSVSADDKTLYFDSKMKGGFGGKDIWKIEKGSDGKWGKPVNMGPEINTSGDEGYPYIRNTGALYFCSNGHPGMGGLDLFMATDTAGKWYVQNMKYPVNSAADDFSIVFKDEGEEGLFSTSRTGGKGKDDIYSFILPPLEFSFQGIVKDDNTDQPVSGAVLKLVGSDGTDMDFTTQEDGAFKYKLNPNTDYVFVVRKKGYLNGKGKMTTTSIEESKSYVVDLRLAPITAPVDIPNIYYDFGKWDLREDSKAELDKLVEMLRTNPTITIELSSHTDMVGDEASNMELSQKRAQSVVDFLITKGVSKDRLTAKGYGKSVPKVINGKIAAKGIFQEGDVLNEAFISNLTLDEEKEAANQINRRTEFKVISTTYIPDVE